VIAKRQCLGKLFNPARGVAASTLRIREVPSVPSRGQSAARATAIETIEAARPIPAAFMNLEAGFRPRIFIIALCDAHWLMREASTQTN
jgi:hypothetical protein